MALTVTTAANTIREAYEPGFQELVWQNSHFLPLFEKITSMGDTAYRFKANSAGNNSVGTFNEGDANPAAGEQEFSNLALGYTYFWFMVQASGHAKDALRSNWINQFDEEFRLGQSNLVDLMNTTFMSGTNGIETAIDSTSTYCGQARSAAAWWESSETGSIGTLAHSDLLNIDETIRDNDKGGAPTMILCPHNQKTNIYTLTGGPAMQNISDTDKAPGLHNQSFGNVPVIALPDWTNTVIMFLDNRPGANSVVEHRPYTVDYQGRSGDSDVYQISWAGNLVCRRPKESGKLTGVTA